MEDIVIGVDLAKRIFQLHGATGSGERLFRKRLTRDQFRDFMSRHLTACGKSEPYAIRGESNESLSCRPPNRQHLSCSNLRIPRSPRARGGIFRQ